jgi:GntR family transcriptional repressor for pyruvate dehydrogenase complex
MVAGVLRERIVNGDVGDGELLPRQEILLEEFEVGLPSLREAMRILETEGLVSVQRGNVGGAVVHRPSHGSAAFILGLVLQSEGVELADLAIALRVVEPACAAMCAANPARRRISSQLRDVVTEMEQLVEEGGPAFTRSSRTFHDQLAQLCGNTTLREVVGTLEALWSNYEAQWAHARTKRGNYPELRFRRRDIADHLAIADAIHNGDTAAAEELSRLHMDAIHRYLLSSAAKEPLRVTEMRAALGAGRFR